MSVEKYEHAVLRQNNDLYAVIHRNVYSDDGFWRVYLADVDQHKAREIAEALDAKERDR